MTTDVLSSPAMENNPEKSSPSAPFDDQTEEGELPEEGEIMEEEEDAPPPAAPSSASRSRDKHSSLSSSSSRKRNISLLLMLFPY